MKTLTVILIEGAGSGTIFNITNNDSYKTLLHSKMTKEKLETLRELADDEIFNALLTQEHITNSDKLYNFILDNNLEWDAKVALIRKDINDEDIFIKPEGDYLKEMTNNILFSKYASQQVLGYRENKSDITHIGITTNDKLILFSRNANQDEVEIQDVEYCYITEQLLYNRYSVVERIKERCNWLTHMQIVSDLKYQMRDKE